MLKQTMGVLFLAAAALTAAAPEEAGVRAAEAKWAQAVAGRDFAALEGIYDEALIYAHSTGIVETKKQYMERLRGGRQRYEEVTIERTRVAVHGEAAVALSWVRMRGRSDAREFNDHLMMTHVWVRKGGVWRLAAHQTTKLAD